MNFQARQVKRCMNAQDDCLSYEALRKEVTSVDGAETKDKPRLIVNPEFVQTMDESDGATQWDKDVEEKVWNEI